MFAHTHILAIVLALTLIVKPCASALAALHKDAATPAPAGQLAQAVQDRATALKNQKECKSSCLIGRIEKFEWRGTVHKRLHASAHIAGAAALSPIAGHRRAEQARSRASPDRQLPRHAARNFLHQLCRQLI